MHLSLLVGLFVIVSTATWLTPVFSQQCSSMSGTAFSACKAAGYNSTFQMPKIDNATEVLVSSLLSYLLGQIKKTTSRFSSSVESHLGEIIVCSILVPRCTNGKLYLPCKRVCAEFLRRYSDGCEPYWLEYYVSYCTLLPDAKASSGKCFEPPGFDKHYNSSNTEVLDVKCSKLIFPWCQGLGYQHTTMKQSTQLSLYRHFYGKNFTNNSTIDKVYSNNSEVQFWTKLQEYTPCGTEIQKMVCADLFPPCFPDEEEASYTACDSTCFNLSKKCPALADNWPLSFGGFFINRCDGLAFGNSTHGFCKRSSWPKPFMWLHHFKKDNYSKPATTTIPTIHSTRTTHLNPITQQVPKLKKSTNIIIIAVIAVVVSLVIIALAVAGMLLWRQRKLLWMSRILKRADDDTMGIIKEELQLEEGTLRLEFDCY